MSLSKKHRVFGTHNSINKQIREVKGLEAAIAWRLDDITQLNSNQESRYCYYQVTYCAVMPEG